MRPEKFHVAVAFGLGQLVLPLALLVGLTRGAATDRSAVSVLDCTTSMRREVSVVGYTAQSWGTTETSVSTSGAEVGRVGEGPA